MVDNRNKNIAKVRSFYEFLRDFFKLLRRPELNINKHSKVKYVEDIFDDDNITITYPDTYEGEGEFDEPLFRIRKPEFTKCPQPPQCLLPWLKTGWEYYKNSFVSLHQALILPAKKPYIDGMELTSDDEVVYFAQSESLKKQYEAWEKKRKIWVLEQKAIVRTRAVFNFFYDVYMDLLRDSDGLEFVVANGFFESVNDKTISYPILSKRVAVKYFVEQDEIHIYDDELAKPVLNSDVFIALATNDPKFNIDQLLELKNKLFEKELHPLDRNEAPDFFDSLVKVLTSKGLYSSDGVPDDWVSNYDYLCYWKPVYLLREKKEDSDRIIEEILKNINEKGKCPQHIIDIVDPNNLPTAVEEEETFVERLASIGGEHLEILLAKEANREQLDIVRQIKRSSAVVVQGPPGTGKTHTIANLLGHFLAQGKNVLVSSCMPNALTVLKEKMPEALQSLCVSVFDDNKAEMECTVNGITDVLSRSTSSGFKGRMEELENERKSVFNELASQRKRLFQIRNAECKTLAYHGESISPIEMADFVAKNKEELSSLIPGEVSGDIPLPLTLSQLTTLYRSNKQVSSTEAEELNCNLPSPEEIISVDTFESDVISVNKSLADIETIERQNEWHSNYDRSINTVIVSITQNRAISISNLKPELLDGLLKARHQMTELESWMKHAAIAGQEETLEKKKWLLLIDKIKALNVISEKYSMDSYGKDLVIPKMTESEHNLFLSNIREMYNRLTSKSSLGVLWTLFHPAWKKALSQGTYNGLPLIAEKNILKLILDKFELQQKRIECSRYWDQLLKKAEYKSFFELDDEKPETKAERFISEIHKYLDWYEKDYKPLKYVLSELQISEDALFDFSPLDSMIQRTDKILNVVFHQLNDIVEICKCFCRIQQIEHKFELQKELLSLGKRQRSSVCENMRRALTNKDVKEFQVAHLTFCQLCEKWSILDERQRLLDILSVSAPDWANDIKYRVDIHGKNEVPSNIELAWRWKQYSALLKKIFAEDYANIQQKIGLLTERYHSLTTQYISARAWYYLLKKIEEAPILKNTLMGYANTVKQIGKTKSARSIRMREKARKLMSECQHAVPVWIMPISKALSMLNPRENEFDVVIIDEASQVDLTAFAITYMAKKVIIVGDDKQVTPVAIGVEDSKVQNLIKQHLQGQIKNEHLYNERSSLYDIARMTYTPRMLTEHFRCMPNIIKFCNYYFYDGKIIPLRDASTSLLAPQTVSYKVNSKGKTGKENKVEAETIVALMQACIEQPEYQGKTFGVISMYGSDQSVLIQKTIIEKIGSAEVDARKILCGEPPNFQGDERDVIFISLVQTPNTNGGPLRLVTEQANMNLQGKRYNVAVSRAKDQLWVVHSLDTTSDLQTGDIRRKLIEFALNPGSIIDNEHAILNETESRFEEEVAQALLGRGYNIKPQWEVGAYRIDFVVMYQGNKIALECDGDRYHSSEQEIQADMERQQILERLGWKFIRLRGSVYYHDKTKAIDDLVELLNQYGIYPEDNTQIKSSVPNDTEILQRVKIRAAELLKEWGAEDEFAFANVELEESPVGEESLPGKALLVDKDENSKEDDLLKLEFNDNETEVGISQKSDTLASGSEDKKETERKKKKMTRKKKENKRKASSKTLE